MKRSGQVVLGLLASVAISACSDGGADATEAKRDCVDPNTSQVVQPERCTPGHPSYLPMYAWYYAGMYRRVGNNTYVNGGSYTAPRSGSRAFSRSSPSVSRGVMGSRGPAAS